MEAGNSILHALRPCSVVVHSQLPPTEIQLPNYLMPVCFVYQEFP